MAFNLIVKKRGAEKAEVLRRQGIIPAVLYGPGITPISLAIEYNAFANLYARAGGSSLVDLAMEGAEKPLKVLIQEVQYDQVKGNIIHVDFRGVRMDREMEIEIKLNFIGEAQAVKELGGTLVKAHSYVNVKCLPKHLVSSIDVDLSTLKTFEDMIHIKDMKLPEGVKVTDNPDAVIAKVLPPLTEEQIKAMEQAGPKAVEEVEVEKKGKEEEEGAEGEEGEKVGKGATAPAAEAPKKEEKK